MISVGIDARMMDHPGIGRYLSCLVGELAQRDGLELVLIGEPATLSRFPHVRLRQARIPIYSVQEQLVIPWTARGAGLLHVPHFNAPCLAWQPLVVTIHDLIYLNMPNLSPSFKRSAAEWLIARIVRQARRIIVVSQATKDALAARFPHTDAKVRVIYEACAPAIRRVTERPRLEAAKARLRLPEEFFLSVGSLRPHKNVATLVRAFRELRKREAVDHHLVLVGRLDPRYQELGALLAEPDDAIHWVGEIGDEDLACCYTLASALVLPSFEEGFGLPLIEAMSCGLPALVSRIPVFLEIADHSAGWFNPYSEEELVKRMWQLLQSEPWQRELATAGLRRAQAFSWKRCAEETVRVYEEAVA